MRHTIWRVTSPLVCMIAVAWLGSCTAAEDMPRMELKLGHAGAIGAVAFSPDDTLLATASSDCTTILWDAATGAELRTLTGHSGEVTSLAFLPDGKTVVSGSWDGTVRFWDTTTGAELCNLRGNRFGGYRVTVSPDGSVVTTGSWDVTTEFWDVQAQARLRTVRGQPGVAYLLALSPEGKLAISHPGRPRDYIIEVRDAATGTVLRRLPGLFNSVYSVAFSSDGEVVAASDQSRIVVWDAATGAELCTIRTSAQGVALSSDGSLLACGGSSGFVELWDLKRLAELRTLAARHEWPIDCLAFSRDDKVLASVSGDRTVMLWDLRTGAAIHRLESRRQAVHAVAFHPWTKRLASGSDRGTVGLWDTATGSLCWAAEVDGFPVNCLVYSHDGSLLASGSRDGRIKLWSTSSGAEVCAVRHKWPLQALALSPDGKLMASISGTGELWLWETGTGEVVRSLGGTESERVVCAGFSGDGTPLAFVWRQSDWRATEVWDLVRDTRVCRLDGCVPWCASYALSSDGRLLAASVGDILSRRTTGTWDAYTGASLNAMPGQGPLAFSPDRRLLVGCAGEQSLRLWTVDTGQEFWTVKAHDAPIRSVAFSPRARLIASCSDDGAILLCHPQTGRCLGRLIAVHGEGIPDLAWLAVTPEGYYDGTPEAIEKCVFFRVGGQLRPAAELAQQFHRPDVVRKALAGEAI